MTIYNTVGLEAEFFLRNEKDELVLPGDHSMPHDDFPLLGEIRGNLGNSREETLSNFMKEYYRLCFLAEKKGLRIDLADGWMKIDPKVYASVVRKQNKKEVSKAENINDYDIIGFSDAIVENGRILAQKVSIGLHVHFQSIVKDEKVIAKHKYESVKLPLQIQGAQTCLDLYADRGEEKVKVAVQCSRITKPVIRHIVEKMDKEVHSQFKIDEPLKFRLPGFYERKEGGRFEYRSLPFNARTLQRLPYIVDYSFSLLEDL